MLGYVRRDHLSLSQRYALTLRIIKEMIRKLLRGAKLTRRPRNIHISRGMLSLYYPSIKMHLRKTDCANKYDVRSGRRINPAARNITRAHSTSGRFSPRIRARLKGILPIRDIAADHDDDPASRKVKGTCLCSPTGKSSYRTEYKKSREQPFEQW